MAVQWNMCSFEWLEKIHMLRKECSSVTSFGDTMSRIPWILAGSN